MNARATVVVDRALQGASACKARSDATDSFVVSLFDDAVLGDPHEHDVALIAVGGYGRAELAPFSDLDIVLVHRSVRDIDEIAAKIWYPIWDSGAKLGHAVRTPKESVEMCRTDLDTATACVTARYLAGNEQLASDVIGAAREEWKRHGQRRLRELHERVRERHLAAGEVAYLLEPNLKEGVGGLRDIHALWWAIEAGLVVDADDISVLRDCNEQLLRCRVALHHVANRPGDVLHLEMQAAVASELGYESDDALMADLAASARRVAWIAEEAWSRLDPPRNASSTPQKLAPGVTLVHGEIHLGDDVDVASDPTLLLRVAAAAARTNTRIDRSSLNRLGELSPEWPDPWPAGASDDLVGLLLEGEKAIPVLESLDQRNLVVRVIPEWAPNRSKPQRNAYHRYTVDRHLWQAAANAARLASRVSRPDLLVLGALFHDIGKGYPGDHTEAGIELFNHIGVRMGLSADDIDIVRTMIAQHLLLPDVATRRDLSDDGTIMMVADAVKSPVVLELLHALTEADSLATGPSAWSTWKAELVALLVDRVSHVLGGGDVREVTWRLFPDANVLELMAAGEVAMRHTVDRITVVSPDKPGTFSRVAGVLSLHGLDVLGAEAHSDEQGMAASEFRVVPPKHGSIEWEKVEDNLRRALRGELALDARLAERAATYRAPRATTATPASPPSVRIDNATSSGSTFLEVRAPDRVGVLHRITAALAEVGLDIRHARVQTLANEVVDTFYVRTVAGDKVLDDEHQREITRAVLFALERP